MINSLLIIAGKLISSLSRVLNLGHGSTWPGHIALSINRNFIKTIIKANPHLKIILIAGTNGKTTTGKLIQTILEKNKKKVFQNEAGANLLNGISSTLIHQCNKVGVIDKDFAIFEIDESTLPLILKEISSPDFIIILNLFRDQLDRYGEINTISKKWQDALKKISKKTKLILNADDPQIAYLGLSRGVVSIPPRGWKRSYTSVFFFGLENKKLASKNLQHASDSAYCPNCGKKLIYNSIYFSHLGDWNCKNCGLKRPSNIFVRAPFYPLHGLYNQYNTNAASILIKNLGIDEKNISAALKNFKPAFGRQEILKVDDRKVQIFLSKNPAGFNESLRTVRELKTKNILIVLNDQIPDGRDVSWIWDVDFEDYIDRFENIFVSGGRAYDMALRLKYAIQTQNSKFKIYEELKTAIKKSLKFSNKNETLYILPTYSAMLETRKILTGRKIL